MDHLLYESKGTSKKYTKSMRLGAVFVLLIGIAFLCFSIFDNDLFLLCLGALLVGFGFFVLFRPDYNAGKAYLRLYDDRIEGLHMGNPQRDFQLNYTQIHNVRKEIVVGNELIYIEIENETLITFVDNAEKVYNIFDKKLKELECTPQSMVKCSKCGKMISRRREKCAYCFTQTQYGERIIKRNKLSKIAKFLIVFGHMISTLLFALGIGTIVIDITRHNYDYKSPFSDHEIGVLIFIVCSFVVDVCIWIASSVIEKKSENL